MAGEPPKRMSQRGGRGNAAGAGFRGGQGETIARGEEGAWERPETDVRTLSGT